MPLYRLKISYKIGLVHSPKTNVTTARKIAQKSLQNLGRVLFVVGKPLYLLFSYSLIAILFVVYAVGKLTRQTLTSSLKLKWRPKKKKTHYFKLPKINLRIPKLKIGFQIRPKRKFRKIIYKAPRFILPKNYFAFLFLIFAFLFSYWYFIVRGLPSPKELVTRDQEVSTKIYDRNGTLLYNIYKDKNRTIVPLAEIPMNVRLATLAAEDAEFYTHPGFSIRGIVRAIIKNVQKGELSGGSTITQQLVKNALLSSEKTLVRKIREIILAIGVERVYSKDEILEMYLNEVSYGGTAYGIQEASRVYFDKNVQNLTLSEAALLAGLPKSPTRFSPFGPNPEEAVARQREVLYLMKVNKFINGEQEESALNERLTFAPNKIEIKAPHFVMYVRSLLEEKYGLEVVEKGGLEVVTTLDYEIQKIAEKAVKDEVSRLSNLHVGNGAALVLDPKTGEILAMVGSKDYFDTASDGNVNVVTSLRQPGSSIKVVNYAYALSNGLTPATIVNDSPITFSVPGQEPYSPKNYDGKFRGNITLRSALAESRNIPAVKVLATYGVAKMIEMGGKMGISTWDDPSRFGLSLTLGGGDVKLIDLARAYATIANYGERPNITLIVKVTNYKEKVLEENRCLAAQPPGRLDVLASEAEAAEAASNPCQKENVVNPAVAFQLIDILSDNSARAPAFGTYSLLAIPGHPEVAVKTGTSNNLKDNLAVGFTQDYLVAAWVGNNDSSPMSRVASGITGATPIFHNIMAPLLANKNSVAWTPPTGAQKVAICTITGTLPCEGCPTKTEWFLKGTAPTKHCTKEAIAKIEEEKAKKEKEGLQPRGAGPAGQITPNAASTTN